jgi:azobenzene reductase
MKVMLVSAIARESSSCYILARQIEEMADAHGDVEVVFVTPRSTGLPLNDGTVDWDMPEVKRWQSLIDEIHAHIWVSPEYHSAMTGAFKNLFDYLAKEPMRGDAVGLVALAGGRMAALNTLNGMSVLARSLGAWVAPDYCAVNSNDVKEGLDDEGIGRVSDMVGSVLDMTRRLYPGD